MCGPFPGDPQGEMTGPMLHSVLGPTWIPFTRAHWIHEQFIDLKSPYWQSLACSHTWHIRSPLPLVMF